MIAYYVHWHYPASADDVNFYCGQDDDKLFHHKENAEKYAKDKINEWNDNCCRFTYLCDKEEEYGLTYEEQEERRKKVHGRYFNYDHSYSSVVCGMDHNKSRGDQKIRR
jgi:hypothetical protein